MIEWLTSSCFSFLEGASTPDALVAAASQAGYGGVGIADRMNQSGVVQALRAVDEIREQHPHFFFAPGIRLHFDHADPLFVYPLHRKSHARLCSFLSAWALEGMRHGEKGLTPLPWALFRNFLREDLSALSQDFILISANGRFYPWVHKDSLDENNRITTQDTREPQPSFSVPPSTPGQSPFWLLELAEICGQGPGSALSLAYPLTLSPGEEDLLTWTEEHARKLDIPLLATSLPLFASREDQDLCEIVTAIRHKRPVFKLGYLKQANSERRFLNEQELLWRKRMSRERLRRAGILHQDPFERSVQLAARHHFSLLELQYRYPRERIPPGLSSSEHLKNLAIQGAERRYPEGIPSASLDQLNKELDLVRRLDYEDYFLTIYDVLEYAREQKILFQGRGSAANSTLCFCLGITAIDPVRMEFLFERFISLERREPPDIDVDFEHERREEVLQEIYRRYGREHAAMVCTYICFRGRMAFRETAKALGISLQAIEAFTVFMGRESLSRLQEEPRPPALSQILKDFAISPRTFAQLLTLAQRLRGLPRHLSIHTGGFVLSSEKISEQCVLEPARMENRSILPWDKDDVDYLRWMKVDFLSLGMLTAIRKCFDLLEHPPEEAPRIRPTLASIPSECPEVYAAMQRADTVGVFQIESRAQMNMLPRLAPRNFYDVVVEVAIVRPGPLQGGMVHPYLRRRQGLDPVVYDHHKLEPILRKTLGVPIFQEQVMKIAVAIGGFTPGEADLLRKAMSGVWRSKSQMHTIRERLMKGMAAEGVPQQLTERLYKQIEGFGEYGFPESHAASFALLTYISQWLKVHRPSEFLCALLNAQPLGFYSPRSLVGDAERHGVRVLPIDILHSRWDSTLVRNPQRPEYPHVRLGLRWIQGLSKHEAQQVETLQDRGLLKDPSLLSLPYILQQGLSPKTLEKLIHANACRSLPSNSPDARRKQQWELLSLKTLPSFEFDVRTRRSQEDSWIKDYDEWTAMLRDYSSVGLTPGRHPATMAREKFFARLRRWTTAEGLYRLADRNSCAVVGLLTIKQRPPTASGLTFLTLEDETGFMNLVLRAEVYEGCRLVIESSPLLAVEGFIQRSRQLKPEDPQTAAVSLMVSKLWNPFLNSDLFSPEGRFKARHYH